MVRVDKIIQREYTYKVHIYRCISESMRGSMRSNRLAEEEEALRR